MMEFSGSNAGYRIGAALIMLLFGVVGLLAGEDIYRRAHLHLLDPETEWGERTELRGRPARIVGIFLMLFGLFFLITAIASIFLLPRLIF